MSILMKVLISGSGSVTKSNLIAWVYAGKLT
jgi:hypothetical protein